MSLKYVAIDLSTKRQRLVDAPTGGGSLIKIPFGFGDASPSPVYLALAGTTIFTATIVIQVPFNGVGATLQLGDVGQHDLLIAANQNDPTQAAEYETNPGLTYAADTQIYLTITPGAGCTQGAGYVLLEV